MRTTTRQRLYFEDKISLHKVRIEVVKNNIYNAHSSSYNNSYFKKGVFIMVSEAQKKVNEKWKAANKEKQKIYGYRSQAKKFINEFATQDDLAELKKMIEEKISE